jgi:hypothetical protein
MRRHDRAAASLLAAVAATLLALAWQAATVEFNYAGDWSALYYTGERCRIPPALEAERIYRIAGSSGYDGQFYHFIAHDPLARRGFSAYVDNPRIRWRRILVPALAHLLAAGDDDYVDSLYAALLLAAVFAGVWWLSRWAVAEGLSPWLGMAFLLTPATLISLDRATLDGALAALTVGLLAVRGRWRYAVLAATPLVRETGLLLVGGFILAEAIARRWRSAALSAATLAPFALWWGYVSAHTAPDLTSHVAPVPLAGILYRATHPVVYELASAWVRKAAVLDYLAFLGVLACYALLWRLRRADGAWLAAAAFCAALLFVAHPQVWAEAYAFGRVASPLLILVAAMSLRARWWWGLAPMAMVLPRVFWQLAPQFWGVVRSL